MHSGLKVNGVKLYKLARQGISVDRKARVINVHDLKIISVDHDEITMKISCTKGTYIRTLIESIGDYLGVGAFTKELRRLRVGAFEEKNMITIDDIINNQDLILPIDEMIGDMDSISVTPEELKILRFGQPVHTEKFKNIDEIAIKNSNCNLMGIGKIIDNHIYPKRLMNFDE
jgi:tRNA pseudouridine55 synthase